MVATNAGWYIAELAFGLNDADRSWKYHIAPVLFKNGQVFKMGTYADYYGTLMPIWGIQNSFVVYLAAGDTLWPGCYVESDGTALDRWTSADLIKPQNGYDTYFTVSLLNRSLA